MSTRPSLGQFLDTRRLVGGILIVGVFLSLFLDTNQTPPPGAEVFDRPEPATGRNFAEEVLGASSLTGRVHSLFGRGRKERNPI